MYPLLLEIPIPFLNFSLKLYSYGLMMGIGFLCAMTWFMSRAKRYQVDPNFMSNVGLISIIGGVIGGRIAFILIEESAADIFSFKLFEVWKGGMVLYGGLITAILPDWIYSRMKKVPFLTVADIAAPTIALGQVFGRLGCFLAGCCYGQQCPYPWAVTFRHPLSLAPLNIPLHPTQLYEPLGNLLVIGALLAVQRYQKFQGQIFATYLFLYAIVRAIVEMYRGDLERGFVDFGGAYPNEWLSTSMFISFGMIVVAIAIVVIHRKTPTTYQAS